MWFGEGDDKFTIDGEKGASLWGTGTEDYVGNAWGTGTSGVSRGSKLGIDSVPLRQRWNVKREAPKDLGRGSDAVRRISPLPKGEGSDWMCFGDALSRASRCS
jgi:hypothetical protein